MTENGASSRLGAFEAMLAAVQEQYRDTAQKMKKLKAEGKEKTVTYRQLMGNKLQLGSMLSLYRVYGLADDTAEKE